MFYARIRLSASDAAVDSVAGAVVVSVCSGKLSLLPLAGKEIGNSYPTICAHFVSELCEACPSDINFWNNWPHNGMVGYIHRMKPVHQICVLCDFLFLNYKPACDGRADEQTYRQLDGNV